MIVKKIRNPAKAASLATRVSALVAYVRAPETENAGEKCTHYGTVGLISLDPDEHAEEMIDLARTAHRSRDPIIHYVLSWPEDEHPTKAQVDDAVTLFLDEIDTLPKPPKLRADHSWHDHQWVYALHEDTDHMHVHLVGNRVDPRSNRALKINRGFDADAGIRAGARIEHVQGWAIEPNKRYELVDDPAGAKVVRASAGARHAPKRPTQRDLRTERQTGQPSATRIAIDRALPLIARAGTWPELHAQLGYAGMAYVRSGPGAVVMVGDVAVKTSRIDTAAGLEPLVKRLGPFESPTGRKPHPLTKQELAELVAGASSWDQLHTNLAGRNCAYERKGSGAIVRGPAGEWKASDLARSASLKRLEARLGPYTEAPADPPPGRDERRLIRTTPEEVARRITQANNWGDLHFDLRAVGATYTPKGSGAVVWLGDRAVKASDVSRHATLARLERRLGPFQAAYAEGAETTGAAMVDRLYNGDKQRRTALAERDDAATDEHETHRKILAEIDEREQAELRDSATYFPPPASARTPPANRDEDEDEPAKGGAEPTTGASVNAAEAHLRKNLAEIDEREQAELRNAAEAHLLHDAVRLAIERKARRARAKENRRYATALAALARRFTTATSKFGWLLVYEVDGWLKPADGWDSTERDATIRPCQQTSADTAVETHVDDVTALRVGDRVEYRDRNDDLACADLGPEIIVRHPSARERQLAGLRLAATKWPGAPVEVVDLPPPGEAQLLDDKRPRVIEDIHEAIRALHEIAQRVERKRKEIHRASGIDTRQRRRDDPRGR